MDQVETHVDWVGAATTEHKSDKVILLHCYFILIKELIKGCQKKAGKDYESTVSTITYFYSGLWNS